ncbi:MULTISPECIES: antitoxin Xre/MbcA/ParS toxin-binding domain-containing protein [Alteromonadales]|jgi:hypothetical protein|uniref:antitoxin Xre/MbcA/ParS toxin-binding domain-containing protein n=1 Tax=Alteromonadales TaxID=135622 RepID=UPI001191C408|nr:MULTISPECIES: antitoxin Xre/MbcA/ParS toxin-binding domain-containing protein [Alteromonadales]MBA6414555.1 DUF2384 domain-containing protein [Colwellia sp. 6M3]MBB1350354.1 DUF2384 domain-containing protein [Pseudoalteromonas sp. SG45-3]MBB1357461.1 DUF2384 domain-containing protein [Pseudoalteromonas sp. SG45-6]TVU68211.1 DUF2384 domain-containing protein [Pseudoalteromonas elyakovii]
MKQELSKSNRVAFETFFKIMETWAVPQDTQLILLGNLPLSNFLNAKKGKFTEINLDVIRKIACLIGIYKFLRILFHSKTQADTWIHRPNKAFENLSALEFMLKDDKKNIDQVYIYLRAQLV